MFTYEYNSTLKVNLIDLNTRIMSDNDLRAKNYAYSIWDQGTNKLKIKFTSELNETEQNKLTTVFNNTEKTECIY